MTIRHYVTLNCKHISPNSDEPNALERWQVIEVRYPELLVDWLTDHPESKPPEEQGVRIGKRADHLQGGRRNPDWIADYPALNS